MTRIDKKVDAILASLSSKGKQKADSGLEVKQEESSQFIVSITVNLDP